MHRDATGEMADSDYHHLYRLGGLAAFIAALLTLAEVVVFAIHPQPATIPDWFALFQNNALLGLLDFWLLELPMYAAFALVFLALCAVLKKTAPALMAVALAPALIGIAVFFATNNPFAMLSLSDQYAAASTDAQRSALLAAGQAVLAITNQRAIGGFNTGLFLVSVAGLIVSVVMLRSASFARSTGVVGILAHGLSLADYLRQALTSSPLLALLVILPNALLLMIWYALVGWRLYRLAARERQRL